MLSGVSVDEDLKENVIKENIAEDLRLQKLHSKNSLDSNRVEERISLSSSSSSCCASLSLHHSQQGEEEEDDGVSLSLQREEGRGEEEFLSKEGKEVTQLHSPGEKEQGGIDQEETRREAGEKDKMSAVIFSSSSEEVQRKENRRADREKKKEEETKEKEELCVELECHRREERGTSLVEKEEEQDCIDSQDTSIDKTERTRSEERKKEEEEEKKKKQTSFSVVRENKKTRALKACTIDSFFYIRNPRKGTGEKAGRPMSSILEIRGGEEKAKTQKEDQSDKERAKEVESSPLLSSLTPPTEGENKEEKKKKKSEEDCGADRPQRDQDAAEVSGRKPADLRRSEMLEKVQNNNETGGFSQTTSSSSVRLVAEGEDEVVLAVDDEVERVVKRQKLSFSSFAFSSPQRVGKDAQKSLSCLASPDGEMLPTIDAEERWKSMLGHSW